jgi:hypothetical protein
MLPSSDFTAAVPGTMPSLESLPEIRLPFGQGMHCPIGQIVDS